MKHIAECWLRGQASQLLCPPIIQVYFCPVFEGNCVSQLPDAGIHANVVQLQPSRQDVRGGSCQLTCTDLGLRFFRSFCGSSLSKRCAWLMGPGAHMSCRLAESDMRTCGEVRLTADISRHLSSTYFEKLADLDAVNPLAPDIPLPFVHLGSKRKQKEPSSTEQLQRST